MAQSAPSAMNAPINLTAPRIKEGSATIWIGKIAYRDCHIREVSADGKMVTLSTTAGVRQLEWSQVPSGEQTKLSYEYSAALARANGDTTKTKLTQQRDIAKALPTASPDPDSSEKQELRRAYLRRIEALRREMDRLDAIGARDHSYVGTQYRNARIGAIAAEISEKETQIKVLDGRVYKLRKIVVGSNTDN
jgi:hypothetical protein